MSDKISVNKQETEELIVSLEDFYDEIESSLTDMSNLIADISNSLEGQVSENLVKKFSEYEIQFTLINDDMKAYIQDFKKLLTDFENEDGSISVSEVEIANEGGEIINVRP